MDDDKLLTPQEVADILLISKRTVYEIIKRNELNATKVGNKLRIAKEDVESYIATNTKNKQSTEESINNKDIMVNELYRNYVENKIVICGQDSILDSLCMVISEKNAGIKVLRLYDNSYNGLCALYNNDVKMTASHIWNGETNEYNIEYAKKMLPGISTTIINLCYRTQGFYVRNGNPKGIYSWEDLTKKNVKLINREVGSGSRILLDEKLKSLNIDSKDINGYDNFVSSHREVVRLIAKNEVDVGVGLKKYIDKSLDVEFIPLHKESYDLIIKTEDLKKVPFTNLIEILKSDEFKSQYAELEHYDFSDTGKITSVT